MRTDICNYSIRFDRLWAKHLVCTFILKLEKQSGMQENLFNNFQHVCVCVTCPQSLQRILS